MSKGRIIVGGAVANKAGQGGEAWVRLNWVLGLRKLGFEVLCLEQLQPGAPAGAVDFFRRTMERAGLADGATLLGADGARCGPDLARVLAFAADAEALINLSGHLTFEPVMERSNPCAASGGVTTSCLPQTRSVGTRMSRMRSPRWSLRAERESLIIARAPPRSESSPNARSKSFSRMCVRSKKSSPIFRESHSRLGRI